MRQYGLTVEQIRFMLDEQDWACLICRTEFEWEAKSFRVFNIDHCGATGVVRGLLCLTCNAGLGCFRDSEILLSSAILYLQERDAHGTHYGKVPLTRKKERKTS